MQSNHAGETGAVAIYRGILVTSSDQLVRRFALRHLETEKKHLAVVGSLIRTRRRSVLAPLWTAAGFLTGALPAMAGSNAVFATVDAVETFVDSHYGQQVDRLSETGDWDDLRETLESLRQDEIDHRDEARALCRDERGALLRLWLWAVSRGSAVAVVFARRF